MLKTILTKKQHEVKVDNKLNFNEHQDGNN